VLGIPVTIAMTEISETGDHRVISEAPRSAFGISFGSLEILFVSYEALVVLASSVAGGVIYHAVYYGVFYNIDGFLGIGFVGSVLHLLVAKSQGLYEVPVLAGLDRRWTRLVCGWILVVLLLTLFMFLLKIGAGVSRGSMIGFGFIGCIALIGGRAAFQKPLRRASNNGLLVGRRVVLLGSAHELMRLRASDLLMKFGLTEVKRIVLSDSQNQLIQPDQGGSCDLQTVSVAIEAARATQADEIVLAMSWSQEALIHRVCERLRASPLPIHLLPDATAQRFLSLPSVATGPLPTLEIQRAPLSFVECLLKRIFDLVVAIGILVMLSPLLMLTALLIKLDSRGPVIFRQRRNGFDGQSFSILKFRTMFVLEDGDGIDQATRSDPRVTRLGRTLRRHSIDELPQLVNVVKGEMSLVGPRPHAIAHDNKYSKLISSYAFRHHVKPGITGLAQVNGLRGETPRIADMEKRVEYDLKYINGWSLMLDLRIIFRTFGEVFRRDVY
jgi:undecaprenyl-phosphate galactose phosphotransferase/putative colanic acid biosynthesis UDP-glucose lipid carrier transferase